MAVKYKIVRKTMKKNAKNDKPNVNSELKNSELGLSAENNENTSSGETNDLLSRITEQSNNTKEHGELKSDIDSLKRGGSSNKGNDSRSGAKFGSKLKAFFFGSDGEEDDEDAEDEITISLTKDFPVIQKNSSDEKDYTHKNDKGQEKEEKSDEDDFLKKTNLSDSSEDVTEKKEVSVDKLIDDSELDVLFGSYKGDSDESDSFEDDIMKADTKEFDPVKPDEGEKNDGETSSSSDKLSFDEAVSKITSGKKFDYFDEDFDEKEKEDPEQTQAISRTKTRNLDAYIGTDKKIKRTNDAVGEKLGGIYGFSHNQPKTSQSENSLNKLDNHSEEETADEADKILESVFGASSGKKKNKKEKKNTNKSKDKEFDTVDDSEIENASAEIEEEKSVETVESDDNMFPAVEEAIPEKAVPEKISSEASEDVSDNDNEDLEEEDDEEEKGVRDESEYTAPEQSPEIFTELKNAGGKYFGSFIWTSVITLLLFYLESACFSDIPHPMVLQPGKFGLVFLLVDLQLLLMSAIFVLGNLADGAKALFTGKANLNSITFITMLTSALHVLVVLFTGASSPDIMVFSSVASLSAVINSFCSLINTKRNYNAFRIMANKKQKFIAKRLSEDSAAAKCFSEYLPEDPDVFSIEKTDFVDGFIKNIKSYSPSDSIYRISIPLCVIAGIALAVVTYLAEKSIYSAMNNFTLMVMMSLPLSSMFVISLPFFFFSKKMNKMETAIIGEKAIDDYCNTAAVSFSDIEVFPSKGVKITIVRAYGSNRIDKTMLYAAKIFKKVGGPLASVFDSSVSGIGEQLACDAEILEIAKNGICARVDGKEVFVGTKDYMFDYEFGYVKDQIDPVFEKSVGRIMYMAIDDEIAAKFYIKYSISHGFENILKNMAQVGICASIRSCDPNIDTTLLTNLLKKKKYPVVVLKTHEAAKANTASSKEESGLVCTSTTANMLRGFIIADKIKQRISTNTLIKFISLLLGVFTVAFLYVMGCLDRVSVMYVLVYQILWMLPVIIPSNVE